MMLSTTPEAVSNDVYRSFLWTYLTLVGTYITRLHIYISPSG